MRIRLLPRDDIFISYPRQGASTYASGLADALLKRGFSPFVDKFDTKPSAGLTEELRKKIRECKMLIVLGTEHASRPIIEDEIKEYLGTGRHTIVPIDFNNAVMKASWFPLIKGIPPEPEPRLLALKDGNPSESVLNRIEKQFTYKRSKTRQRLTTISLASASIIFTVASIVAGSYAAYEVTLANQARAEASKSQGDAVRAQGERDSAQTERDKANLDKDAANTQATQARKDAEQSQKDAADAEARAGAAVELQQQAEAQTKVAVGEGMLASGYQAITSIPSDAVNLAFAAKKLLATDPVTNARSSSLLSEALENNPVWFQHAPDGTDPDSMPLSGAYAEPTDPIATDKGITRVLTPSKRPGAQNGRELLLRDIPSETVLSRLVLSDEEEILTPTPLNTRLFIVHNKNKALGEFKLYDLTGSQLTTPVLSLKNAKSVECTAGSWPCFVLTGAGEVVAYDASESVSTVKSASLIKLPDIMSISAHPLGGSVLIVQPTSLTWFGLNDSLSVQARSDIALAGPAMTQGDYRYQVQWGPRTQDILLASNVDAADRFSIYSINGLTGKSQEIYHHGAFTFLPLWRVETARKGTRLLVTGDQGVTKITVPNHLIVIDLNWQQDNADGIASMTKELNLDVRCRFDPAMVSGVDLATISPNGNYVVVVRTTAGKTPHAITTSVLEQWDLLAMDEPNARLEPVAVELKIGRTHTPITRLAYSEDSSRLLVWDAIERASIFRLSPGPPDRFNQKSRDPWASGAVTKASSPAEFTNVPLSQSLRERYKKWLSY